VPPGVADAARAQVLLSVARHTWPKHGPEAAAAIDEALALARQAGDAATEADALPDLAIVQSRAGDDAAALESLRLARTIAERADAYQPLLCAVTNESHVLEGMGEHEQAAEVARAGIARAENYGLARSAGAFLAINVAEPFVSLGRWDEAIEVIEHALALSPSQPTIKCSLQQLAGEVALRRGDLASAAASAAAAWAALGPAGCGHQGQHHMPLARLDLELRLAEGQPAEALAAADAAGSLDLAGDPRYAWPLLPAAARAVTAATQAGRGDALPARAADLLGRLETLAGQLPAVGPVQQANRLTFRAEALRAEQAGHLSGTAARETLAAFDAAAAAWERAGQPYPRADALLRGAEAALAAADRDGAVQRLRCAADLADGLGARPLADEIGALRRSARIGPGGHAAGLSPAAAAPLGLTAREFEVLRLVADGRSNPEIAARLFISAKTASVHVSNILAKVGVASRGEAAAEAHRLRLFDATAAPRPDGRRPVSAAGRD
jgi:ATP/maltotriose-dependent transcriptional regulator MalT